MEKLRKKLQTANLTQTTKQGQIEDRNLMIMRDVQEKTTHTIRHDLVQQQLDDTRFGVQQTQAIMRQNQEMQ